MLQNISPKQQKIGILVAKPKLSMDAELNDALGTGIKQNTFSNMKQNDFTLLTDTCGVKLERPGYFTVPSCNELDKLTNKKGECLVTNFIVGHIGYGCVYFPDTINVANLNLDEIVHFEFRKIEIYPDDTKKPPVGEGLNRRAVVRLYSVWPLDTLTNKYIKNTKKICKIDFELNLIKLCKQMDAVFLDYQLENGVWTFYVQHFSKYRFIEGDEETEVVASSRVITPKTSISKEEEQSSIINIGLGGTNVYDNNTRFVMDYFKTLHEKELVRKSFFDIESVSDDVSSSDGGIIQNSTFLTTTSSTSIPSKTLHIRFNKFNVKKRYTLLNSNPTPITEKHFLIQRNYMDCALFKGKSFKVGWGRNFTYTSLLTLSSVKRYGIDSVAIINLNENFEAEEFIKLEQHLEIVLNSSKRSLTEGVPLYECNAGSKTLLLHRDLALNLQRFDVINLQIDYYREIWDLCISLWGPLATTPAVTRELFSEWLKDAVSSYAYKSLKMPIIEQSHAIQNAFSLLTGHDIDEASMLCMKYNLPNLSILISLTQEKARKLLEKQILFWKDGNMCKYIPDSLLKIYMIIAGVPLIPDLNICENLDWKRTFGIHFWYVCSDGSPISFAVRSYEEAFMNLKYACEPLPELFKTNYPNYYDLIYQLITVYSFPNTNLDKVLNPATHTSNINDYRLSWILLHQLNSLNVGLCSEQLANSLHIKFAFQLEQMGKWHWAIFVILFIKEIKLKFCALMSVLERNLQLDDNASYNKSIETFLIKRLNLAPKLLHKILAQKSEFFKRHIESFTHCILASEWNLAHDQAVTYIIPNMILTNKLDILFYMLKKMLPGKDYIRVWNKMGGMITDFLQIRSVVFANKNVCIRHNSQAALKLSPEDLIEMTNKLNTVCLNVQQYPFKTEREAVVVSEMCRFISVLVHVFHFHLRSGVFSDPEYSLSVFKDLIMPPDYKIGEFQAFF